MFNISHVESPNLKCDCKMMKVAVIVRNVTAKLESYSHNSKCDCKFNKVAVKFHQKSLSRDCI